jgi:uncharacterized protein YbjQ (UPF0145 family)
VARSRQEISAEREREQEQSLARVEQGGIPVSAERRLRESSEQGGAFSSDLSIAGWALAHRLGLRPLSQVMGSSIYQIGYQMQAWPMTMGGNVLSELSTLSEAWNEVRRLALNRLELEARHAGADAVIGVQVRTGAHDWAQGSIEYVLTGTAVRRREGQRAQEPVLTELSVADYSNLLSAGIRPLGIVAWTSVFYAAYGAFWPAQAGGFGGVGAMGNFELPEFTAAVYSAREQVMGRLGVQAQRLGASGIVGVRIGHTVRRQDTGGAGAQQRGGVVVTFDAIGTAVADTPTAQPQPPKITIDLST